jgi:MOSC domain-containing protein YiiM
VPCYKLGIRLGRRDVLRRMLRTGRTGFCFSVAVKGEVGAGDAIELVRRSEVDLTVADVVRLFTVEAKNQNLLRRAIQSSVLPPNWKDHFRQRLE